MRIVRIWYGTGKQLIERRQTPLIAAGGMLSIDLLEAEDIGSRRSRAGRKTSARTSSGTFAFGGGVEAFEIEDCESHGDVSAGTILGNSAGSGCRSFRSEPHQWRNPPPGSADRPDLSLGYANSGVAQGFANLALEAAYARLARVARATRPAPMCPLATN